MEQSTKFESFKDTFDKLIGGNNTILHQQFLLYKIGKAWQDIAGKLAEHCSPLRIDKSRLIIATDNAPLANQLFMVKRDLLKKVNTFLEGKYVFLDMSFVSGVSLKKFTTDTIPQDESQEKVEFINCPQCGALMDSRLTKCFNCLREEKLNSEEQLQKELINVPWLTFEDIKIPQIDKLVFERIYNSIAGLYFERVRTGSATEMDKLQAVLFYTKKKPAEISQALSELTLAILTNDERIKE